MTRPSCPTCQRAHGPLLCLAEAARHLHISPKKLRSAIRRGDGPAPFAHTGTGERTLYPVTALDQWAADT
jgi:hypothetical protein